MPTHTDALALVYARSLYELAQEAGGNEKILEIGEELQQIAELARADAALAEFLRSPVVDADKRAASLRSIFADRVTDITLRFLLVLNNKDRLGHLEAISEAYDSLVQESFGRIEVDVYTPGPLGEPQRRHLAQRIEAALGKEPVLHAYTDPDMIGGVTLRIGDRLIDGSVATRLRRIKQNILTHGTSTVRSRAARIIEDKTTPGGTL